MPKLDPSPPAEWSAALEAARTHRVVPRIDDLPLPVVLRWLQRAWAPGAPLVCAGRDAGQMSVAEWQAVASGGWLLWEGDAPPAGAYVGGERLRAPPGWAERLLTIDAVHLVVTDPALESVRRALDAHVRVDGPVLVEGETGSGKRSLCRWAHRVDGRPLSVVRTGDVRAPRPGSWRLYENVEHLDAAGLALLREDLLRPNTVGVPARGAVAAPMRRFGGFVASSPAMAELIGLAERLAPWKQLHLLIIGEPGVGKEVLAHAIHEASRRPGRLVTLDLQSRAENLAVDDLFGHEAGAYSGGAKRRAGAAREAHRGTLFLDEVGNLDLGMQARLLRLLEAREVQPLGADHAIPVDIRVLAATNADLEAMVRRGEFRADLLERMAGRTLRIPPLRERTEDILPIALHMLDEVCRQNDVPVPTLSETAADALVAYAWPGNVRQLRNVIAGAAAEADREIRPEHLGPAAPENLRRVPVLVTASELEPVEPALRRALSVTRLLVPPLRDRPTESRARAILHFAGDHPFRPEAVALLARLPWWGGYPEMARVVTALCRAVRGPVDRAAIEATLPGLLDVGEEPIVVLMHPSLDAEARLHGLERAYDAAAVGLGRASGLSVCARSPDAHLRQRVARIRARVPDGDVGWLSIGGAGVSRAECLLVRRGAALVVEPLGETSTVRASPLRGHHLQPLTGPIDLQDAGVIRFDDAAVSGAVFVFLGRSARAAAEPLVAELLNGAMEPTGVLPPVSGDETERRRSRWRLSAYETEAFVSLIEGWLDAGEDFSTWVRRETQGWEADPELQRLSSYLQASEPPKYTGRLLAHPPNDTARDALRRRLSGPGAAGRLARLPAPIREALSST